MGKRNRESRKRRHLLSDGNLLEGGNVGGGAFIVGSGGAESEVECGIWNVATVWDGEVAGMAGSLIRARQGGERKVLILADSKAAIAAVRKAHQTGKARSRHLQKTISEIAEGKNRMGEGSHGHPGCRCHGKKCCRENEVPRRP